MTGSGRGFRLTAPRPPKPSENDVEGAALDFLRLRGYFPVRLHIGRFRAPKGQWVTIGVPGLPDWALLHRLFPAFFMETKRPGREAEPHQITKHREIQLIWGLSVAVVDSIEGMKDFLARHERSASLQWGRNAVSG